MKILVALLSTFIGFSLMIEASETVKLVLLNQNNSVHFLIVIAIGATTATYAYFVRYLTESKWLAMIVFIGFGTMVYLTIFSTIYAENLTRGIGGHLIGYLIVYLSRFLYLELNEKVENPRPNMIRD